MQSTFHMYNQLPLKDTIHFSSFFFRLILKEHESERHLPVRQIK